MAARNLLENIDLANLPKTRGEAVACGSKFYFTGKPCVKGHLAPKRTSSYWCVTCDRITKRNGGHRSSKPEHKKKYRQRRRIENPISLLLQYAKRRALLKGRKFTLSAADISIPNNCPCCGCKIKLGGKDVTVSPSLDRYNNLIGYIPENVYVLCWGCNDAKGSATLNRLKLVISWMKKIETRTRPA